MTITIDRCANPDCRREMFGDPSDEDPRFCHDCGDLFPAWCPQPRYDRRPDLDEWERLYDDSLVDGAEISGGQCGNCGAQAWVVHPRGAGWVVVCEADPDHADDPDYPEPCGTEYSVEYLPGRKIVW